MNSPVRAIRALEYRARVDGRTLDEAEFARLCWGAADARWKHRSPTRAEFLRFATRLALERVARAARTKGLNLHEEVARRATRRDARRLASLVGEPGNGLGALPCPGERLLDRLRRSGREGVTIR